MGRCTTMAEKAKQHQGFAFSLPVSVVVLAIAYIYLSTVFVFIDRWLGLFSSPRMVNAVVFTTLASMCVFSYRSAISTDPGRVPSTYMSDVEDVQTPIHEIKHKLDVAARIRKSHAEMETAKENMVRESFVPQGAKSNSLDSTPCKVL